MSTNTHQLDTLGLIEVSAVCDSTDGYVETVQWFRWLELEVQQQMSRWNDIVPEREFGLLPTLGNLRVDLNGPNIVLAQGKRPQFGVDPLKVLELLQGAGLYSNKNDSIRELLQNSIDATLIHVWHAQGGDGCEIDWQYPDTDEVRNVLSQYPIQVIIQRSMESDVDDKFCWELIIKDNGVGISRNDLNYMLQVGGSHQNHLKRAVISTMPEWMKPSGAFGIGLQSAFLLSPEVRFSTKSALTSEELDIRFTSPLGDELGLSQIKLNEAKIGRKNGTTLTLKLMLNAVSKFFGYRRKTVEGFGLGEFDPIRHTEFPLEAYRIAEMIVSSSEGSLVPVSVTVDGVTRHCSSKVKRKAIYDRDNHLELSLQFKVDRRERASVSFRGQHLNKFRVSFSFLRVSANFLSGEAQSMLTINREDVRDEARSAVIATLRGAVNKVIGYFVPEDEMSRMGLSAYARVNGLDCDGSLRESWRNIKLLKDMPSIGEILELPKYSIQYVSDDFEYENEKYGAGLESVLPLAGVPEFQSSEIHSPGLQLLLEEWAKSGRVVQEDSIGGRRVVINLLPKGAEPMTVSRLAEYLLNYKSFVRVVVPIFVGYEDLMISEEADTSLLSELSPMQYRGGLMLLPFYFGENISTDGFEEVCLWVHKNAKNKLVSIDRIRNLYSAFVDWIDTVVMKGDLEWAELRVRKP